MPLTMLLRCDDLIITGNYYRDTLGFTVTDSPEATLTVQLEDCRLTFTQQDLWGSPQSCPATIYFAISQVDQYYQAVKDRVAIAWPLQDMSYGSREFGIRDCNGYHLAFTQISTSQGAPGWRSA